MQNKQPRTAFASAIFGITLSPLRIGSHPPRCTRAVVISAVETNSESANFNLEIVESTPDQTGWNPGRVQAPRPKRGKGRSVRGKVRIQGKYYRLAPPPPQAPGLRITSGIVRGRRIKSPNVYLRPMMGKVREALFSMLEMFETLREDGTTLDLFAGSGSIGIESMSRGMGHAVFVDSAAECTETIEENLLSCGLERQGRAVCGRVEDFLRDGTKFNNGRHYDLITLTPPYEEVEYGELMTAVAKSDCVGEGTFVVVEYPIELRTMPPVIEQRLIGIRNRKYGRTVLALYACQPDIDIDRRVEEFIDVKKKGR